MEVTKNKTHLVFHRELLEMIDKIVGKRKRSQFVIEATKDKLAREKFAKALKEAAGCWTDKNHPDLMTKRDVERYVRNLRKSANKRLKEIYD